jgi:hypothetical protein
MEKVGSELTSNFSPQREPEGLSFGVPPSGGFLMTDLNCRLKAELRTLCLSFSVSSVVNLNAY